MLISQNLCFERSSREFKTRKIPVIIHSYQKRLIFKVHLNQFDYHLELACQGRQPFRCSLAIKTSFNPYVCT